MILCLDPGIGVILLSKHMTQEHVFAGNLVITVSKPLMIFLKRHLTLGLSDPCKLYSEWQRSRQHVGDLRHVVLISSTGTHRFGYIHKQRLVK